MSGTVITRWPAWEERPSAKNGCNLQPAHSRGESAATHQPSSSCLGALWWMQKEVSVGEPHRCGVCSPSLGPLRESDRSFFIRVSILKMKLVTYGSLAENKEAPSEKDTEGSGKRMVAGKGEGTPGSPGPTADGGQGSGQPKMPAVLSHTGYRVGSCARWRTPS